MENRLHQFLVSSFHHQFPISEQPISMFGSQLNDIKRLKEIVSIMFDEGFDFVLDKIELRYLVPLRKRFRLKKKEIEAEDLGVRLRRLFEKLGPTFIKFGQILSLRPDLVGINVAREFEKLQDKAPYFSTDIVEQLVEQELGKPIDKVFKKFEEKPKAAASLAQVHRAVLKDVKTSDVPRTSDVGTIKNGDVVALKIQRPSIRETIERDIHLMLHLAKLLEKIPEVALRQPVALVKEFADWTMRELDFELEGQRYDRFRLVAEEVSGAKVPRVYWEYTTPRFLVMEYVDGIRVNDLKKIKKEGIDPKNLAKIGFNVLLRQIFIEGIFQADPHPGNLFALKGDNEEDVLCFYDFGMVGYLNKEDRTKMLRCISAFVKKDAEEYLSRVMVFVSPGREADKEGFMREARTIIERFMFSPVDAQAVVKVLPAVLRIGLKYKVIFPTNLALFARSLLIMANVGLRLDPKFNIDEALREFVGRITLERMRPDKLLKELPDKFFEYAEFLKRLPERTQELLEKIEKGEVSVKINLAEIKNLKAEFDRENDIRVFSILTGAAVLGSVILLAAGSAVSIFGISLSYIGFGISGLMILWLIRLIRQKAR